MTNCAYKVATGRHLASAAHDFESLLHKLITLHNSLRELKQFERNENCFLRATHCLLSLLKVVRSTPQCLFVQIDLVDSACPADRRSRRRTPHGQEAAWQPRYAIVA